MFCGRVPCKTGGGVRSIERAQELLNAGAKRVIFGSALLKDGVPDVAFAKECAAKLGIERLTFAIDSRSGKVAVKGWKENTTIDALASLLALVPYSSTFLYPPFDPKATLSD